jgi:hypothetical protein
MGTCTFVTLFQKRVTKEHVPIVTPGMPGMV